MFVFRVVLCFGPRNGAKRIKWARIWRLARLARFRVGGRGIGMISTSTSRELNLIHGVRCATSQLPFTMQSDPMNMPMTALVTESGRRPVSGAIPALSANSKWLGVPPWRLPDPVPIDRGVTYPATGSHNKFPTAPPPGLNNCCYTTTSA